MKLTLRAKEIVYAIRNEAFKSPNRTFRKVRSEKDLYSMLGRYGIVKRADLDIYVNPALAGMNDDRIDENVNCLTLSGWAVESAYGPGVKLKVTVGNHVAPSRVDGVGF